jgi:hypothetical protein
LPSLYLGKIGGREIYEIHALTKDLPFREFKSAEISDGSLYENILKERFRLLESGKPIYCTAISPDLERRIEYNPHDDRAGTVHIVALDKHGSIACSLSIAVDTNLKDKGDLVGMPLENRWKRNGYPEGASLDTFRERYVRLNYHRERSLKPWEMAELYRHFRAVAQQNDTAARIGLYTGAYHLPVREAIKKNLTPTWLWVFDAIPSYFNLYRWVGAAVLRDPTIEDKPRWVSPNAAKGKKSDALNSDGAIHFHGRPISRTVKTPIPMKGNGKLEYKIDDIHFLDGVVDIFRAEKIIRESPIVHSSVKDQGFLLSDKLKLRLGLTVTGKRTYDNHHADNPLVNFLNSLAFKQLCPGGWDFNHIGDWQVEKGKPIYEP